MNNKGKAAARNYGIWQAKGAIILLTDADMEADYRLLEEHWQVHQLLPNAAFEGLTINPDNKPYIKTRLKPLQKLAWSYFLTGNLSISKSELLSVSLFDENFAGYGWEDLELGYRLHLGNVPLYYLPAAKNYHRHPVSEEDLLERKYQMGRSAALFYKKHPYFEIKMFLGMNPLAMAIFYWLKGRPQLVKFIEDRADRSGFYRYLLEEYHYRRGLTEALQS
jgi:GT2 family glycosyltransferase